VFVVPALAGIETSYKRDKKARESERFSIMTKPAAKLTLPNNLQTEITNGDVVLLFGAGASLTAKKGGDKWMPSIAKLTELIADRFLDEDARKYSLDLCAEYAIGEAGLLEVQNFIASDQPRLRRRYWSFKRWLVRKLMIASSNCYLKRCRATSTI
jgi:hypothetical protein